MNVVAGIDVGGTRIKAVLLAGEVELARVVLPTPPSIGQHFPDTVAEVVEALLVHRPDAAPPRIEACGIVVPGMVDESAGVGRYSANLGWRDLPLTAPAAHRLGIPVVVGHDVRAGLLAEARLGAAQGARHGLFLPIGTGIAGALMIDGHILVADGWSGELGHVVVVPGGQECRCGARGCLEAISSASAIQRRYAALAGTRRPAEDIVARAGTGDAAAAAVWSEAIEGLARAVAMVVTATGVDLVLVGGGLAGAGETLLTPLRAAVESALTFQRRPRIVPAGLGDRAGSLGAALLAADLLAR